MASALSIQRVTGRVINAHRQPEPARAHADAIRDLVCERLAYRIQEILTKHPVEPLLPEHLERLTAILTTGIDPEDVL